MQEFKINSLFVISLVLVFAFSFLTVLVGVCAAKQDGKIVTGNQAQAQDVEQVESENATDTDKTEPSLDAQAKQQKQESEQINAEEHRSAVSKFVRSLLSVADREGGIGQQVRVIAQEQNQSASTTVQAMEKVQTRSKIKTFFFGSDYKNLGTLRSEMVQTKSRLEQLNRLVENTQNDADKTELQNQIKTLEQEQVKIESFLKTNENQFSLFGWFTKLFSK